MNLGHKFAPLLICREAPVRFGYGYGLGIERFRRFRFSVLVVPLQKGFSVFQYSLTGKEGSGSGFGSWETVPAVPVPLSLSVSGKTVPTVPVSGSIPGTKLFSQGFEGKERALKGGNELFDPRPFAWKTPTPGRLRTQEHNICFFSRTS